MFIFSIFFGLINLVLGAIGAALSLLLLPFRIVLKLVVRNFVLFLILLGVLFLYRSCATSSGPTMVQPSAPAPVSAAKKNPANNHGKIDTVRRREDGDSAFATDLYSSMTDPERNHYSQIFYSVMSNVADGDPFPWENINIAGVITPTRSFTNNNGKQCRSFREVLKVHAIEQTITGTACDRGDGGWCKLKPNATPACGLSTGSGGILDRIKGWF
jgi:surface antigen